jgi:hypothetical protein
METTQGHVPAKAVYGVCSGDRSSQHEKQELNRFLAISAVVGFVSAAKARSPSPP